MSDGTRKVLAEIKQIALTVQPNDVPNGLAHIIRLCIDADRALSRPDAGGGVRERRGIYIASKTKHADRWRFLRDEVGEPIISTWIDEAGEGESADLHDLWRRCLSEASGCQVLIAYREKDEVLKGGWVEIGAALSAGIPVYAVGLDDFTIAKYRGVTHFPDMKSAVAAARSALSTPSDAGNESAANDHRNQAERLLNAAMDHIADTLEQPSDPRAWAHLLIYCPAEIIAARADAVNESAEARLREAHSAFQRLAADCHRSKWQFDMDEENQPNAYEARRRVRRAFDELQRIGNIAMHERDALKAIKSSGGDASNV